jgi:DNA-directed RNA polymerase subunit RPC12/RpoP
MTGQALYYQNLHGAQGHIHCSNCSDFVLVHVNWFKWNLRDGKAGIKTSYQCLLCGEFRNLDLLQDQQIGLCSCGGTLSNKHQLFCPNCKSFDLRYKVYFFT